MENDFQRNRKNIDSKSVWLRSHSWYRLMKRGKDDTSAVYLVLSQIWTDRMRVENAKTFVKSRPKRRFFFWLSRNFFNRVSSFHFIFAVSQFIRILYIYCHHIGEGDNLVLFYYNACSCKLKFLFSCFHSRRLLSLPRADTDLAPSKGNNQQQDCIRLSVFFLITSQDRS